MAFCPGLSLLSWARLGQCYLWAWARLSLQAESKTCWGWCSWGRQSPPWCSGLQTGTGPGPLPIATQTSAWPNNQELVISDTPHFFAPITGIIYQEICLGQVGVQEGSCMCFLHAHAYRITLNCCRHSQPLLWTDAAIITLETIAWGVLLWMISFIMMKAINSEEC